MWPYKTVLGQPWGCPGATFGVVSEKALCLETSIKCCLLGCLGLTWSCPEN